MDEPSPSSESSPVNLAGYLTVCTCGRGFCNSMHMQTIRGCAKSGRSTFQMLWRRLKRYGLQEKGRAEKMDVMSQLGLLLHPLPTVQKLQLHQQEKYCSKTPEPMMLTICGRSLSVAHDAPIIIFLHDFEMSFLNPHPHPWPSQPPHQLQIPHPLQMQVHSCHACFIFFARFLMYSDFRINIIAVACLLTTQKRLQH